MEINIQVMAERFTQIEGEVRNTRKEVADTREEIGVIGRDVVRITEALLGNKFTLEEGLITEFGRYKQEVKDLKDEIKSVDEKHERRFERIKFWWLGAGVGAGAGAGFGVAKFIEFLSKL